MTLLQICILTVLFTAFFLVIIVLSSKRTRETAQSLIAFMKPVPEGHPARYDGLKRFTRFYKYTLSAGNHVSFVADIDEHEGKDITGVFLGETEDEIFIIALNDGRYAELNKRQLDPSALRELNGLATSLCAHF